MDLTVHTMDPVIKNLNRELREIAYEYEAAYLDIYSLLVDAEGNPSNEYLQDDGVHLSSKGYDVWSNALELFLEKNSNQ